MPSAHRKEGTNLRDVESALVKPIISQGIGAAEREGG
jgi:hypothetical protein